MGLAICTVSLRRYKVDVAIPAKASLDPRIAALYNKVGDLVGIEEARGELIMRLAKGDDKSAQQRIVSVVGFGGLGKTTLATAAYDELKGKFDCTAFVPVGRNPDLKKVLKAISVDLGMYIDFELLDERQMINKLREFLEHKRCVNHHHEIITYLVLVVLGDVLGVVHIVLRTTPKAPLYHFGSVKKGK
jgi:disease resistance protein RPM1